MRPIERIRTRPQGGPRSGQHALWWTLLVAALAGAGWMGFRPGGWFEAGPDERVRGAEVRRGPLRISVLEHGNLKAADADSIKSEVEGRTSILWLIDEGTHVEKGDLVCELDVTEMIDRRFAEEISVNNAKAAYTKDLQALEIQKSQNASDIALAEQNLTFAGEDLQKFKEGQKPFDIDKAKEAIELAREEQARAADTLIWSSKLAERGFLTETELEADRLSANRAKIMLEQSLRELELLETWNHPREEDKLVADLEEAKRELERVRLQAAARLVEYEAALKNSEARLKLESDNLAKIERQIGSSKMYSPSAGMVVYAQEEGGRWGNREPLQEGTEVRERQEIITIPSAGGMIAQASLHESVLKQVRSGQQVLLKVDALPGLEFSGRVGFVAVLPDQQSYFANPNMRVYRTEIQITDAVEGMRPGMSCSVEVLVEEIPDAIHVPVQAVFRHQGENISFVTTPGGFELRAVEIGSYNDKWVQIVSGLSEGEEVLLSPPPDFTLEAGEEEFETPEGPPEGFEGMGEMPGRTPQGMPEGMHGGRPAGAGGRGPAAAAGSNGAGERGGSGRPEGAQRRSGASPGGERGGRRSGGGAERGGGERPGGGRPSSERESAGGGASDGR